MAEEKDRKKKQGHGERRRREVELPTGLEIVMLLFIFSAEILGEINAFYLRIPAWDTILHSLNGF